MWRFWKSSSKVAITNLSCLVAQPSFRGGGMSVSGTRTQLYLCKWHACMPSTHTNGALRASGGWLCSCEKLHLHGAPLAPVAGTCMSGKHLHSHAKFHLHERKTLILTCEAMLAQVEGAWMEGACAHVQSSNHTQVLSLHASEVLRSCPTLARAKLHVHACPLLVWVDFHAHVLAHLSHALVLSKLWPRSGLQPQGWDLCYKECLKNLSMPTENTTEERYNSNL